MSIARNLTSKDLYADPYPVYRELRDDEPWAWSDGLGLWLVSRYEDVVFVDEHPEIFTAHQVNSLAERTMGLVMIRTDGAGDTLFAGGPGATGRSFSDFPTIIRSIRSELLPLPLDTRVLTGHGATTTIGAEAPHLEEWILRGH